MKKLILNLLLAIIVLNCFAQTDSTIKAAVAPDQPGLPDSFQLTKPYKAWVKTVDGKTKKGVLYQTAGYGIDLVTGKKYESIHTFNSEQIQSIRIRRKNAPLKGALIGMGVGAITGIVIGLVSGDDPIQPYTGEPFSDMFIALGNSFAMTAGEKATAGGIGLGITGGVVGLIFGSVAKKKFIIGGKKQKVRDLQAELMQKLVVK